MDENDVCVTIVLVVLYSILPLLGTSTSATKRKSTTKVTEPATNTLPAASTTNPISSTFWLKLSVFAIKQRQLQQHQNTQLNIIQGVYTT